MNSGDLTCEQIKTLQDQLKPAFFFPKSLVERMEQRGFHPDDEILKAARDAFDRLHGLSVRLHYLGCNAFKRELEADRKAKGKPIGPGWSGWKLSPDWSQSAHLRRC